MMEVGLLWHDSGAEDLAWKLSRAAKRYHERFGDKPDVCYVNPAQLPDGDRTINGILVRPSPRIMRHHFWLGKEKTDYP